jgi:hypothetical protein
MKVFDAKYAYCLIEYLLYIVVSIKHFDKPGVFTPVSYKLLKQKKAKAFAGGYYAK